METVNKNHLSKALVFATFLLMAYAQPTPGLAHPGNTYSDGSHHCWTRCTYWGVEYGELHYHNSGYSRNFDDTDSSNPFKYPVVYQRGSQNTVVEDIQFKLSSDSSIYPEGIVSGYYGRLTENAVQRFQVRHGLSDYGMSNFGKVDLLTKETIDEVYSLTNRLKNLSVKSSNAEQVHKTTQTLTAEELQIMIDTLDSQISTLKSLLDKTI